MPDMIVVGSGPNGLAAAIELARAGLSVRVLEAADTVGGGVRSAELTLPGFVHDVCSAIHPLGVASPFFRTLPLAEHGLVLGLLAHAVGWPFPRGGSQSLADALASYLRSLGGEIETGRRVESLAELGDTRAVLLDVTPRGFLALAGDRLPSRYRRRLQRYRYGPGVFKLDWALEEPIPWSAGECRRAATVHRGATLEE